MKSSPSVPDFEIIITFTNRPSKFASLLAALTSPILSGDKEASPEMTTYFAGKNVSFARISLLCRDVIPSIALTPSGGLLNKDLAFVPYRVKPILSNASAIGITPPSI